jgi:mRNA interferase MazF
MVNAPAIVLGDVVLVALNPTRGQEIQKTRPCLIV